MTRKFKVGDIVVVKSSYRHPRLHGREYTVLDIEKSTPSTVRNNSGSENFIRLNTPDIMKYPDAAMADIHLMHIDDIRHLPEPEFSLEEIESVKL